MGILSKLDFINRNFYGVAVSTQRKCIWLGGKLLHFPRLNGELALLPNQKAKPFLLSWGGNSSTRRIVSGRKRLSPSTSWILVTPFAWLIRPLPRARLERLVLCWKLVWDGWCKHGTIVNFWNDNWSGLGPWEVLSKSPCEHWKALGPLCRWERVGLHKAPLASLCKPPGIFGPYISTRFLFRFFLLQSL